MLQVLFNSYIADEINSEVLVGGGSAIPGDAGPVAVLCTVHIAGTAPAEVVATTRLLTSDDQETWTTLAICSTFGAGSQDKTITHVPRALFQAHLKPETEGSNGNPNGGGTVAIVY